MKHQTEESWAPKAQSCGLHVSRQQPHWFWLVVHLCSFYWDSHQKSSLESFPSVLRSLSNCTSLIAHRASYFQPVKEVKVPNHMSSLLKDGFFNHCHYLTSNVLHWQSVVYISECFCWGLFSAGMIKTISPCNRSLFFGSCIVSASILDPFLIDF